MLPRERGPATRRLVEPKEQRSFLVFLGDWVLFGFGMSVVNPSTVMPALVRELTSSAPLIGLVEAIKSGAWLLPQLACAWVLSGTTITRRHLLVPFLASRLSFALIGPLLLVAAGARPGLALGGIFILFTLFFIFDALGSLPWFDLFTVSLSPVNRSRLIGTAQVLAGAGGIGVGYFVARVLAGPSPGFPSSYAILFAASGCFMAMELAAISFLRVPPDVHQRRRIPLRSFVRWVGRLLARDRDFRKLIIVRLLVGSSGLAIPFYMVFGLDVLRLGPESVGVFTAAQVIGSIASAPLMAVLSERRGTKSVIRLVACIALLLPLLGLALVLLKASLGQTALLVILAVIFFLMGGVNNGQMAGFINYLLDYAPGAQRPVYIGLANTLNGLVLVAPVVGGWILSATSYPVLFAVTAAVSLVGLASTARLSRPSDSRAHAAPGS
jgi:hypothetical protein